MAGLARKNQKLFGGALVPANNLAVWGSLKAGAQAFSNDPDAIQSLAWLQGLAGAVIGNRSPGLQDLNSLFFELTYQLQYILARGIPVWQADTEYNLDDVCRVGKTIYTSLADANVGNAPPSAQWENTISQQAASSPFMPKAWVCFNGINVVGSNCPIFAGTPNVGSVTRTGTGAYLVNFSPALPSDNYGFLGSCGGQNGEGSSSSNGNDNVLAGSPGSAGSQPSIKTAAQLAVFCRTVGGGGAALQDSSAITVGIFGL